MGGTHFPGTHFLLETAGWALPSHRVHPASSGLLLAVPCDDAQWLWARWALHDMFGIFISPYLCHLIEWHYFTGQTGEFSPNLPQSPMLLGGETQFSGWITEVTCHCCPLIINQLLSMSLKRKIPAIVLINDVNAPGATDGWNMVFYLSCLPWTLRHISLCWCVL